MNILMNLNYIYYYDILEYLLYFPKVIVIPSWIWYVNSINLLYIFRNIFINFRKINNVFLNMFISQIHGDVIYIKKNFLKYICMLHSRSFF